MNLNDGGAAFFDEKEIPPFDFNYTKAIEGINSEQLGAIVYKSFGQITNIPREQINSDYESYTDLDFLAFKDALSNIHSKLNKIGMPQLVIDETYSVDIATMRKHNDIYLSSYNEPEKINWTKDDEFYLFSMQQLVDNIPLVNKVWTMPDGAKDSYLGFPEMPYTVVSIIHDKNGIRELNTSNILDVYEKVSEDNIITVYEALDKLIDSYALTILEEDVNVLEAELVYLVLPEKNGDGYNLVPGWVFVSETIIEITGHRSTVHKHDVIDAVTGQLYQGTWK